MRSTSPTRCPARLMTLKLSPIHPSRRSSNILAVESATKATKDAAAWPRHKKRHATVSSARTTKNATPRSLRFGHPSSSSSHTSSRGAYFTPTTDACITPIMMHMTPLVACSSSHSNGVVQRCRYRSLRCTIANDRHLPVDLLAVLGPQRFERRPAPGAGPLGGGHIVDLLPGLQMGVVPPAVARASPALPTPGRGGARAGTVPLILTVRVRRLLPVRGRAGLLRRATEQHPAQDRDLFGEIHGPLAGLGQAGSHVRQLRFGPLGTLTPVRHIGDVIEHRRGRHPIQDTPAGSSLPREPHPGCSRTAPPPRIHPYSPVTGRNQPPHGITEYLPPGKRHPLTSTLRSSKPRRWPRPGARTPSAGSARRRRPPP